MEFLFRCVCFGQPILSLLAVSRREAAAKYLQLRITTAEACGTYDVAVYDGGTDVLTIHRLAYGWTEVCNKEHRTPCPKCGEPLPETTCFSCSISYVDQEVG